jgi:hypothetical protein
MPEDPIPHGYLMGLGSRVHLPQNSGKATLSVPMNVEHQPRAPKAKTARGQWKVLALMAFYLVLAVGVGVARSELHSPRGAAAAAIVKQVGGPAA